MQPTVRWQAPFFTFWTAQAFSMFGSNLAQFALVWWLTEETGSATVLAIASLVAIVPGVLLGPLAGVLVDRWPRRWVIIAADLVGALAAAGLAVLFWLGHIGVWPIYVAMAVRALAGAFHFAAVQSSTSLMVPEEQLARVAGLNQLLQGVIQIASPPLGALILTFLPFAGIMGIDVVTALVAVGLVFIVVIPQPTRQPAAPGVDSVWADLLEGFQYIWQWPGLRAVLVVSALLNLVLTPAFTLMPILVTRHFGGDALELAWLSTAFGAGFVLGGLLLSLWGGFRQRIYTALLGVMGMGIGALLVAAAPANQLALAVLGMGLVGVMNPLANGPFFAILQSVVAPAIQGRVFTVIMSVSGAMAPLGLLVAGPIADQFGVRLWYLAGGAACLLLVGVMLRSPSIMHLEEDGRVVESETTLPTM
ncbi:MAG TPA: MFS transporter [Caldilineaceae bacterium]|nr:MFS transporter [Caldilineaceae bacterium]